MITEIAYAKINLTLRILPKRSDGYHEVETIMAPIALYDTLTFTAAPSFAIKGVEIADNIMAKVAKLFFAKYNLDGKVEITLNKQIPVAAGLAGGSSDAAATLRGLNRFYNLNLPLAELESICNAVGSDVSYCLYQKLAYCTGRGEKVELLKHSYASQPLLLIKPNFGLSTKEVYQNYQYLDHNYNQEELLEALEKGDLAKLDAHIFNDLTLASQSLKKELLELQNTIKELGFVAHQSGSGPTYFVLNYKKELLKALQEKYPAYLFLETRLLGVE